MKTLLNHKKIINEEKFDLPDLRILLLEDSEDDELLILREFERQGVKIRHRRVLNAEAMKKALAEEEWDAVVADYNVPGFGAAAGLKILESCGIDIPFIVVSSFVGEEAAADLMRAGAQDFVSKNNLARLVPAITREIKDAQNRREKSLAESSIKESNELLRLLGSSTSRQAYLNVLTKLIIKWSGLSMVGVRLTNKLGEIPYAAYEGYSRDFWEKENKLILNKDECACTRVVLGRSEATDVPAMTAFGSFRCGDAIRFLNGLTDGDKKKYRGTCMIYGFTSIAVIPIKYGNKTLGAIHMADKKGGLVPDKTINFIESMVPLIGEAVHKFDVREKLAASEKKVKMNYEIQSILNKLTRISLENIPLNKMLEKVIDELLAVSWINIIAKSGIWLTANNPGELNLVAERGLSSALKEKCQVIPFGNCLCGRAAQTGRVEFSNQLSDRHTVSYPGMTPHGHYCVPILSGGKTLGVMNFYIEAGHEYNKREAGFLQAASNVAAGIIERQRAKEALKDSEEKYRKLVDNANEAVVVINEKGFLDFANDSFFKMSGYAPDELKNIHFSNLIHSDDHDRAVRHLTRRLKGEADTGSEEYKLIDKTGHVRHISYNTSPIREKGKVVGLQMIGRDVTENKILHDKIRRAKEHYEQVIDTIEDSILVVDKNFKIRSCNKAFAENVDVLVNEVNGRGCSEIMPAFKNKLFKNHCLNSGAKINSRCLIADTFKSGQSSTHIVESQEDKSRHRFHQISLFPAKNKGEVYQVVATIRDITGQKQSEEEIRRLHEFNQRILDNSPVSIVVIDHQGTIISANNFALKLMDKTEKQAINRKLISTNNIKRNRELAEKYTRLLEKGEAFHFDNMPYIPDGSEQIIYLNIIALPLLNNRGKVEGAISMAMDNSAEVVAKQGLERLNLDLERKIKEQKIAEEQIRKLSEINQRILDNVPLSLVLLDKSGLVLAANKLASDLMDEDHEPIVGRKLTDTAEIKDSPRLSGLYRKLFRTGAPFYYDNLAYFQGETSEKKSLNIIAVPLFGGTGKVVGAISMALDNTAAVQAKEKLKQLSQELEKKVKKRTFELNAINKRLSDILDLKSKFVADASHELRTPLTVIQGNLDLAIKEAQTNKCGDVPELYPLIMDEIERMRLVLTDMTLLTNVDIGSEQIDYEKVDLNKIINSAVQSLKVLADQKEINLEYDKDASPIWVMGDEIKLDKLLINIVRNGIKYTSENGFVRILSEKSLSEARIIIEDNGIGIPKEDIPYIFERFYRVDKARSRKEGGTGLGLSIAKWIAEAHGGEITVDSAFGKGTKFTVHLPPDFKKKQREATLF